MSLEMMPVDHFWDFIEKSLPTGFGQAERLINILDPYDCSDKQAFVRRFIILRSLVDLRDIRAASYLFGVADIYSYDSFVDFSAGLMALGKQGYEDITANPDNLADYYSGRLEYDHPAIVDFSYIPEELLHLEGCEFPVIEFPPRVEENSSEIPYDFDLNDKPEVQRKFPKLWKLAQEAM